MKTNRLNRAIFLFFIVFSILFLMKSASANYYIGDVYFTIPDTVFMSGERIELKGYLYLANYTDNGTLVSSLSVFSGGNVSFEIRASNLSVIDQKNFTTDSGGAFYSKSNYYTSGTLLSAPSTAGSYSLRATYEDANSTSWFSEFGIVVVNQTLDLLNVRPEKAKYNPSENVEVEVEAIKKIGDNKSTILSS